MDADPAMLLPTAALRTTALPAITARDDTFGRPDARKSREDLQPTLYSINDLVDELLLEVASYLEGNNHALGRLIRTSTRFKAISGDLMYRTVEIPRAEEDNLAYLVRTLT
jgi:hypothetical protein